MSETPHAATGAGPTHRSIEIGVALATIVFALIVIGGSLRVGIGWAFDGPRAGFFPFYLGLLILIAGTFNLFQSIVSPARAKLFAEWSQLGQVLSVVVPAAIYVVLVPWIGIYAASMLLIAVFMKRIGRYGWKLALPIAVGVPLITFIVFERWFLVPLPKGPIEEMLGF
jgi:hypothetical protein